MTAAANPREQQAEARPDMSAVLGSLVYLALWLCVTPQLWGWGCSALHTSLGSCLTLHCDAPRKKSEKDVSKGRAMPIGPTLPALLWGPGRWSGMI